MIRLSATASLRLTKKSVPKGTLFYSIPIDYSSTADSSVISIILGVFFTTSILR